jgi:hypothetical protein
MFFGDTLIMSSQIRPAMINKSLDELRRDVCEEFDELFKRVGVKKKMSLSKADIIISLRIKKLRELEAKNYGIRR